LLPFPEGEPAEKKPWSTPTVEEVPWDTLPTEVRMLVLGLPDPEQGYYGRTARAQLEEEPDAVADVPDQNFKPASSDRQPVLEGDRHREAIRARNREALQRWERRMIIDKPTS
jgi:hypothetical protein